MNISNNNSYECYKRIHVGVLCLIFLVLGSDLFAKDRPEYDELRVDIRIERLGTFEIPIAIEDEQAFVAVAPLFEILQLRILEEENGKILSGYVIQPTNSFSINSKTLEVKVKDEVFKLSEEDFILTTTTFYLKSTLFQKIFDFKVKFHFRTLSAELETDLELPVIKQMRLGKLRENIQRLKGFKKPDTLITQEYPYFRAGMLDWGVFANQQTTGNGVNRINLGLGTMIVGGETNLRLNYATNVPLTSRNQFYQWKYVNNESKLFKQVTVGKIFTRSTSTLFAPVVGAQITNTPVLNRRSFGTFNLSDFTEPRWTVELYVNNVLIDYTEADASGFYNFDIPLMYGNTNINLRFYGPYGEERIEERAINIPYNFIPKNELEYTLSAGIVENGENSKFSRLNLNYGLSNWMTIGGGVEYLSGVSSGEVMPFIDASARIGSNLLFSGEYTYGVRTAALLSYRTKSNLQINLDYTNYNEIQTAINYNYLEERKLSLSTPIRTKNFSVFSRLSINQIILPTTDFTTTEFMLSGSLFGVSTNFTTLGIFSLRTLNPTIYSTLSQTYRLPYNFLFSTQLQYGYSAGGLTNGAVRVERPMFNNGFVNVAYQNNFRQESHSLQVGLRYNFNFAQTSLNTNISRNNTSFAQASQGSLLYNRASGSFITANRSSIGRSGISIFPFLDLNANGKKDELEPPVAGLKFKRIPGNLKYNNTQTVLRISNLQPYQEVILELDPLSLDNIGWRIEKPTIAIEVLPNQFHKLDIPVSVVGEVSGMIYLKENGELEGQGRIILNILDEKKEKVTSILSEGDGYFTYLGLKPGSYSAEIDPKQMEKLGYIASEPLNFEIEITEFGDIVDDLEFVIEEKGTEFIVNTQS